MSWTLPTATELVLRMQVEVACPDTCSVGVQAHDRTRQPSTTTETGMQTDEQGDRCFREPKKLRVHLETTTGSGSRDEVCADRDDNEDESRADVDILANEGTVGRSDGAPGEPGRGVHGPSTERAVSGRSQGQDHWGRVLPGVSFVTLEDSQL